jgi:hypothetical protein
LDWNLKAKLNGFQASVITLSCLNIINIGVIIAASDSTGHINIWHRKQDDNNNNNFELIDEINTLPIQMPYSLLLTSLPKPSSDHQLIGLLLGCVDAKIHISISTATEKLFCNVFVNS